jgi:hypothetical protein
MAAFRAEVGATCGRRATDARAVAAVLQAGRQSWRTRTAQDAGGSWEDSWSQINKRTQRRYARDRTAAVVVADAAAGTTCDGGDWRHCQTGDTAAAGVAADASEAAAERTP